MSALPIANYLRELVPEHERGRVLGDSVRRGDVEARIAEARAKALAEARAASAAELETRLAEEAAAFEERLATERLRWTAEEGERIGARITAEIAVLEATIGAQIARILKPLLRREVEARALASLGEAIDGLLTKGTSVRLAVSGPADLLDAVRATLDGRVPGASFTESDSADITISADETILETQIGAWARSLDGGAA